MSIYRIYILIVCLIISITNAFGTVNSDSLFRVLKIKTQGDYYVIHAKRNDSLFKIVSKKVSIEKTSDLEELKKGKHYHFNFGRDNNDTVKYGPPLAGIANNRRIKVIPFFIDGKTRIRMKRRFHNRIYLTRNLMGLYYSRQGVFRSDDY